MSSEQRLERLGSNNKASRTHLHGWVDEQDVVDGQLRGGAQVRIDAVASKKRYGGGQIGPGTVPRNAYTTLVGASAHIKGGMLRRHAPAQGSVNIAQRCWKRILWGESILDRDNNNGARRVGGCKLTAEVVVIPTTINTKNGEQQNLPICMKQNVPPPMDVQHKQRRGIYIRTLRLVVKCSNRYIV